MNAALPAGLPRPDQMRAAAESACALLKVLSNPDRLLLLCELSQGERCVSDLETRLDIRQPTLSQQLGVLRDNALVRTRREGKAIHYSLDSPAVIAVMGVLYEQFCGPVTKETRDAD
ncbi:MAG: winged helix-turn-helix transcriptional regulator [Burkholderia sp.]|jgi:DNA-binding transcriptional ArsR family regulator|uniref:ArsR/SmtB family transcription factor n=1 Tax=Burkholderia TaxID=32008 RepID=UPI001CF3725E|nr:MULTISPECIES: metalloregulator ArsR/SmtB family transcription factor [Burkholderia]MCA3776220.1 winged helix-turn-helix transcriptional regulator [Burkholderia sp.]MCA3786458.1 winged helix-turn-helix transcriptional regulator [Burkholderia sp.]MCA3790965.1 winged helix-turn-helix transcriptional regulator [Burkholderia sp.]MCA3799449.1 winged helix-turn-helix transcriptional regulator [Burkholderia sp.]MCA3810138.1 winged helix-turn-helix transcriptional regulator [Burkholderia sp.]